MKDLMANAVCVLLLAVTLAGGSASAGSVSAVREIRSGTASAKWYRTELYFGRSKADGTTVTDEAWRIFLDEVVTPRFPDGFSVLDAHGQYRTRAGVIQKEESKVIVFFYTKDVRKAANEKLEQIREEYKKRFEQESVLRIDISSGIKIAF